MENTDFHTTTHTPESANADKDSPPKRGRGRPAKYAKEEREQKYKESRVQWNRDHNDLKNKSNIEYLERSRFAYRLLCDMWNKHQFDSIGNEYKHIIQELVENKKILST